MSALWNTDDQRRHDLFNGPQRDPTAAAARHGYAYAPRRATAAGRALMPDDFMPIGPHAGKHLRAVPQVYFAWVQAQAWSRQWKDWQPVADFLDRHPAFQSEINDRTVLPRVDIYVDALRPCCSTQSWPWKSKARLYVSPGNLDWLHTFATGALGLRRAWFVAGTAEHPLPHYPLSPTKHPQALEHHLVQLVDAHRVGVDTRRWSRFHPLPPQAAKTDSAASPADAGESAALPTFTGADCPASRPRRLTAFDRINSNSSHCKTTKRGYSKREAQEQINKRLSAGEQNRPDFLRAYECPHCRFWHLTRKQVN